MKWIYSVLIIFAFVLLSTWYFYKPDNYQTIRKLGQQAVQQVGLTLKSELQNAIKQEGVVNAISFCNTRALSITEESALVVNENVLVKRVTDKSRNPLNKADVYEAAVLERFGKIESKESDYILEITDKNQTVAYKYFKPIYIESVCLTCHGGDEVPPAVDSVLKRLYPDDEARNYSLGELRGMFSVDIPASIINKE